MSKPLFACMLPPMPMTALGHTSIGPLTQLSTESLRARSHDGAVTGVTEVDCPGRAAGARSRMLSCCSDGLGPYAWLELPATPSPEGGYPVALFLHGWVGADAAPDYPYSCNQGGYCAPVMSAWSDAGYAVLMPGYRGHGTVAGKTADGHDWMKTWDNDTYLSPVSYAVDALNLLAAAPGMEAPGIDAGAGAVKLDLSKVHALGHSQGGDVAAIVLAATGKGAANGLSIASSALGSGTYVDRFSQLQTDPPMETALEAVLAADGTWTGTTIGADGTVNPNFVFGSPPNRIGTLDQTQWDWQKNQWSAPLVRAAIEMKLDEMYSTLNAQVTDAGQWSWAITDREDGGFTAVHDTGLVPFMQAIGAFDVPQDVTAPLNLHFSDRDFCSVPAVNTDFCARGNGAGAKCHAFEYFANTHELSVAGEGRFSPEGTVAGFAVMSARDPALIVGQAPEAIKYR